MKYSAFLTMVALLVAGCATTNNKQSSKDIKVAAKPNALYRIAGTGVYGVDGETIITGYLEPQSRPAHKGGHVDISVVSAEGRVLEKMQVLPDHERSHHFLNSKGIKRNYKPGRTFFHVSTNFEISEGSKVLMGYHSVSLRKCES